MRRYRVRLRLDVFGCGFVLFIFFSPIYELSSLCAGDLYGDSCVGLVSHLRIRSLAVDYLRNFLRLGLLKCLSMFCATETRFFHSVS